jgi:phage shock protein C
MARRFSFDGMRRIPQRGWIAGVCAGIAEYFDWNVRLLRLILVVTLLISGFFPIGVVYLVLWYVLEEGEPGSSYDTYVPAGAGGPGAAAAPVRAPRMGDIHARFSKLDQRLRNIEECVTDREFELRRELKKLET